MRGKISNSIYIDEERVINIGDVIIFTMGNGESFICVVEDVFMDYEEQEIMIACDTKATIYLSDVKEYKKLN